VRLGAGQVAVVTGGASGIGLALCQALTARGVAVVVADLSAEAGELAASRLRLVGGDALSCATDVRSSEAVDDLAAFTLERYGRVDLICNNAGVVPGLRPLWEQDAATWRWLVEVSLLGVAHGIRSFVPHLIAQGSGHVLNTASMAGLVPVPLVGPYGAVKHAVVGLSETLAAELRMVRSPVGVTVLCPARVATALEQTSYAARPEDVPLPVPGQEALTSGGGVLTAEEVARLALVGIEADALHVLTHPESAEPVRRRVQALLDDVSIVETG
jgi:NAD(P)-dependent dehydrogenase (short-subunit alcohol dehydrogenase family)